MLTQPLEAPGLPLVGGVSGSLIGPATGVERFFTTIPKQSCPPSMTAVKPPRPFLSPTPFLPDGLTSFLPVITAKNGPRADDPDTIASAEEMASAASAPATTAAARYRSLMYDLLSFSAARTRRVRRSLRAADTRWKLRDAGSACPSRDRRRSTWSRGR